jgi:hypothetical protein
VVSNWIAANDDNAHVLSVIRPPRNINQIDGPNSFDYDVSTRRARKAQAEAIAAVGHTIGTAIGRIIAKTIGSLRDHLRTRRQIERLSYLTPRLLDDMGLPYDIQIRARALQAYRQPDRLLRF